MLVSVKVVWWVPGGVAKGWGGTWERDGGQPW